MVVPTHTQTITWSNGSTPLSTTNSIDFESEANSTLAVTLNASTKENFSYNAPNIGDVYILLSGGVYGNTVVLTTYAEEKASQGSALDTITLYNDEPVIWRRSGACPLQKVTDIRSIKVVSSLSVATQLDIRVGYNG